MTFRSTSPLLFNTNNGEDSMIDQCPVGMILTESPHVYDAILAHSYCSSGCFDPLESPHWLQSMLRIIGSEKGRMHEIRREERNAKGDAARARRAVV